MRLHCQTAGFAHAVQPVATSPDPDVPVARHVQFVQRLFQRQIATFQTRYNLLQLVQRRFKADRRLIFLRHNKCLTLSIFSPDMVTDSEQLSNLPIILHAACALPATRIISGITRNVHRNRVIVVYFRAWMQPLTGLLYYFSTTSRNWLAKEPLPP